MLAVTLLLVLGCLHPVFSADACHGGYLLYTPKYGQDVCLECFPGQFMPHDNHTHRQCYLCTEIRDPQLEILISPCNKTHDTEIHCIDGYYRTQPSYPDVRGQCQKCAECDLSVAVVGRSCQTFSDTVCCPSNYYEVYINRDGKPECVRECGQGQMLDPVKEECVACPSGTYMDEGRHINIRCKECEKLKSKNDKILNPCNFRRQTMIGCIDGFYRQRQTESFSLCVPCSNCSNNTDSNIYAGRACDQLRDTVCCPHPNMTVVDVCDSARCESVPTTSTEHKSSDGNVLTVGVTVGLVAGAMVTILLTVELTLCALWYRWLTFFKKTRRSDDMELVSVKSSTGKDVPWKQYIDTFVSLSELGLQDLPSKYRGKEMFDLIKLQADLAVLVSVEGRSQLRPDLLSYPYSKDKSRNEPHTGSGWVERLKMYTDQLCPCKTCQQSAQPVTSWGEVVICTAARVVFDITEGRNSRCYFFYDTPDTDLQSCPSVSGAVKVLSDAERDCCYLTFVTHDMELLRKLHEMYFKYHRLRREIKLKYGVMTSEGNYTTILHKRMRVMQKKYEHFLGQLDSLQKQVETAEARSTVYEPLVVYDEDKDNEKKFDVLIALRSKCEYNLEAVTQLMDKCKANEPDADDKTCRLDEYWRLNEETNDLEKYLHSPRYSLKGSDGFILYHKPSYNKSHPFAVIISHPHGRSKQVSFGEINDCMHISAHHRSVFRYTNFTATGSEGARVFILGRTGPGDPGHSKKVDRLSESGAWPGLIPYLIDLSAMEDN